MNEADAYEQLQLELQRLTTEIEHLNGRLAALQQEKIDLEIMLQTTTEHSDQMLKSLQQQKGDLEILIEATTEHSDSIAMELKHLAQEERRQREEQFQQITSATPVGLIISRIIDGQILYANEAMGTLLGLSPETLLNRRTLEFYHDPVERERILADLDQNGAFQGEVQFKRADETLFWALLSLRPFRFQGRQVLLAALHDITDRKAAEAALRLAEAKYRGIFENAIEGMYRSSPEGYFLEVNPALAHMLGYSSPQAMQTQVTNIAAQIYVDPSDYHRFMRLLEECGKVEEIEYQVVRQDGTILWFSEWARAIHDAQGNFLYYEGGCVDVTKRKAEEQALKQQLRELRIEIDQARVQREVAAITETDYFQQILEEAENLRLEINFLNAKA